MPWTQVREGLYERPFDNLELCLKLMGGLFVAWNREHWAINIAARLDWGELPQDQIEGELRRAWIHTRHHCPLVATRVEGDRHVYEVPNADALASWVNESFVVQHDNTVDEFLRTATVATYSSLHYFPNTSQILMRTHHWQIDGIGALHFLHKFLALFVAGEQLPAFGDEWQRLPLSHAETLPLPNEGTKDIERKAQQLIEQTPSSKPSIGLPVNPHTPGGTVHSTVELDPSTLTELVASCKAAHVSVTAAVHAAIVVATQDQADSATSQHGFTSLAFFNHRAYLPEPYNDTTAWPMGCYMLTLPFSQPAGDFHTHVRALQELYHQPLGLHDCSILEYYEAYTGKFVEAIRNPPPRPPSGTSPPMPSQPQLSSLGVVDDKVRHEYSGKWHIRVDDVVPLLDIMTTPLLIFQWSWRGRMRMNALYNENYYRPEAVDHFLTHVKEVILENLVK